MNSVSRTLIGLLWLLQLPLVSADTLSGLFLDDAAVEVLPAALSESGPAPLQVSAAAAEYLAGNPLPANYDATGRVYSVSGFADENIDLRSLQLYWETTDLTLPGNAGFDLEISRSYNKTPYVFQQMGNWVLGIPRILIPTGPIFLATAYPDNPWLAYFKEAFVDTGAEGLCDAAPYLIPEDGELYVSPWQLSIPGERQRVLMEPNPATTAGSYPDGTVLITADNWIAECIPSSEAPESWGSLPWGGYKVTSPEGMAYHFDVVFSAMPGELGLGTHGGWLELVPSRIEDVHGNYFEFEYATSLYNRYGHAASQLLYRIVAYSADGSPDGRAVQFTYDPYFDFDAYNFRNFYGWKHQVLTAWVSDPAAPGQPNQNDLREVHYEPEADVFGNLLASVTLPESLRWEYSYDADGTRILLPSAVDHSPLVALTQVTLPTGGVVDYDYHHAGQNPGIHWFPTRLSGRTTSGTGVQPGVWSYSYNLENHLETTTVSGPDRVDEYEFYEGAGTLDLELIKAGMDGRNYGFPLDNGAYMGRLRHHKVSDLSGALLQSTALTWGQRDQIGLLAYGYQNSGPYVLDSVGYFNARAPVPVTTQITNHQTGASFARSFSIADLNDYGHPLTVTESGINGASSMPISRDYNYRYFNNLSPWIIGRVAGQFVSGFPSVDVEYSSKGLPVRIDRYGIVRSYNYATDGTLFREGWQRDNTDYEIVYRDYKRGIARDVQYPEDIRQLFEVADIGRVTAAIDGEGNTKRYEYDLLGRLKSVGLPGPGLADIQITYPTPTESVFAQGDYRRLQQADAFGRITHTTESDVSQPGSAIYTMKRYDAVGRLQSESLPEPTVAAAEASGTSFSYDALGRLRERSDLVTGATAEFCYQTECLTPHGYSRPLNNGYGMLNERGFLTVLEFGAYGDPSQRQLMRISQQETGANGGSVFIDTTIARDALSNVTSIEQDGLYRTYKYTSGDLLSRVSHPEAGPIEYFYDDAANLIETRQADRRIAFEYDGKNRRTAIHYSDATPSINYVYTKNDYIAEVSNGLTSWSYEYAPGGILLGETLRAGGEIFAMQYEHTNRGLLSAAVYPSGYRLDLMPNALGQASRLGVLTNNVSWHANGELASVGYINGLTTTFEQTGDQRLQSIRTTGLASGAAEILYSYDELGNTVAMDYAGLPRTDQSFGYDGLNRLTTVSNTGSYLYSAGNNLLNSLNSFANPPALESLNYDAANRLITAGQMPLSYDDFGNVQGLGADSFLYDGNNQLKSVSSLPGTTYFYDGNLRRTLTTKSGDLIYSGYGLNGKLLFETNVTAGIATEHYYLSDHRLASRDYSISPGAGADEDADLMPDYLEALIGTNPAEADGDTDADGDGATNFEEFLAGSLPLVKDTDKDGMPDGFELTYNLHPVSSGDAALDSDGDNLSNLTEYSLGTNPLATDTDGDGLPDGDDASPLLHVAANMLPILQLLLEE